MHDLGDISSESPQLMESKYASDNPLTTQGFSATFSLGAQRSYVAGLLKMYLPFLIFSSLLEKSY